MLECVLICQGIRTLGSGSAFVAVFLRHAVCCNHYELFDINLFPGVYCNITWDTVMCWDYTEAGTEAVQNCPDYVNGLHSMGTHLINIIYHSRFVSPILIRRW